MRFGPEFLASGQACCYLWVFNAHYVELCLLSQATNIHYPMQPDSEGRWPLRVTDANLGALYRYRIMLNE